MLKILLVKTSSMGDVIHCLPVVGDIRANFPDARIDWVVEENFAGIPALHPGVSQVIPVAVRRWRKNPFSRAVHAEVGSFVTSLRSQIYDVVLDLQGLLKSALITRLAHGTRCGFDRQSAREPISARFYDEAVRIEKGRQAVERNRLLAGHVFGYTPDSPVDYGIVAPSIKLPWLPANPHAVLLHATSRDDKLWPEADWVAVGAHLAGRGISSVLPWGSAPELARSQRLAHQIPGAIVPPALTLGEAAAALGTSVAAIGVDTGLIHLAGALGVPSVAVYCASDPGLTGLYTCGKAINLGSAGAPPDSSAVIDALNSLVAA